MPRQSIPSTIQSGGSKTCDALPFSRLLSAVILVPTHLQAVPQGGQMESSRGVAGGGVSVPGWTGKIDAKEEAAGMTLNSAKLAKDGDALHVTTGPAVTYWNPAEQSAGRLHRKSDVQGTKVHEPQQPPTPLRVGNCGQ